MMQKLTTAALLAVAAAAGAVAAADPLVVPTEYGPVSGLTERVGDQTCKAWRGVRYAAPPTGALRWAPPTAPANWTEPLDATVYGNGCPQRCVLPPHTCPVKTGEDCLFLNVFAPEDSTPSSALPVLFWIHGGHFEQGSGEGPFYDGVAAAFHTDTVVVSINYRLGALGFLRNDGAGITGNFGFYDQLFALQWARRNVAAFGGDPERITIFGQSAGGTSVSTLLTSPSARGLFQHAIVESNPIGLPLMAQDEGNALGGRFAKDAGCGETDLPCMRSKDLDTVLDAQKKSGKHLNIKDVLELFYMWAPTIDGTHVVGEPLALMQQGRVNAAGTVVAGTVQEEGRIFIYMAMAGKLSHLEYDAVVGATFAHDLQFFKVLKQYPGKAGDNRDQLARLATDYLFKCPTRRALRGMQTVANTYQYRFNHSFSFDGWGPQYTYCMGHVCHGSELPFVWDLSQQTSIVKFTPGEVTLGANMLKAWASVAHTGAPAAVPAWPQYSSANNETYLFESGHQAAVKDLDEDICNFWDTIGWRF